ncbi:MAG: dTDP-4-dehydrorhamnose reductase [Burkholderiales bacterium]|nr:dTDP-4-dehydrorhamnose reductase [Burkholderiales bacterium]
MRRILIIGKNGQVGWELERTLSPLGHITAIDQQEMDLANPDSISSVTREIRPDLIVNAAAYTAVDKAEAEADLAMQVNGIAPGILAQEAKALGAAIVHYSTDYVFDGTKIGPYLENDIPCPLSVYGRTKLAGEDAVRNSGAAHLIFRTSWVYGVRGHNFLHTILRLARERNELRIVDDQIGAPTWSRMIAEVTAQILAQCFSPASSSGLADVGGIYNLTSSGQTSWHGFAKAILDASLLERKPELIPIPTESYPLPAPRPKNSALSHEKLESTFGIMPPSWDACLSMCMRDLSR